MKVTPLHYRIPGGRGVGAAGTWCLWTPVEQLLDHVGRRTRVLDVGCGNGFWAGKFVERGCTVVGIDPSPSGVKLARQTVPEARFEQMGVCQDICTVLAEPPFDLVVSMEVVEHLYSPREWVEGCFAALRLGGQLICSTPYHGYWKNLLISLADRWDKHWSPLHEGGHIKFWSKKTLSQLLVQAGFQGIQFRFAGRFPYLWKAMIVCATRPH